MTESTEFKIIEAAGEKLDEVSKEELLSAVKLIYECLKLNQVSPSAGFHACQSIVLEVLLRAPIHIIEEHMAKAMEFLRYQKGETE